MKTRLATKQRRSFQLESLESRTVLSGAGSTMAMAHSKMPTDTTPSQIGQQSGTSTSPTTGHSPTNPFTNDHGPSTHHSSNTHAGQSAARQLAAAAHRQQAAAHRLQNAENGVNRSATGLNSALANLQLVESSSPAASTQQLNQALGRLQRAGTNLGHSLAILQHADAVTSNSSTNTNATTTSSSTTTGSTTTGSTTSGSTTSGSTTTGSTTADPVAAGLTSVTSSLQSALTYVEGLQATAPATSLTAIENVLQQDLAQIKTL